MYFLFISNETDLTLTPVPGPTEEDVRGRDEDGRETVWGPEKSPVK